MGRAREKAVSLCHYTTVPAGSYEHKEQSFAEDECGNAGCDSHHNYTLMYHICMYLVLVQQHDCSFMDHYRTHNATLKHRFI